LGGGGVYFECLEGGELKVVVNQACDPCTQELLVHIFRKKQREPLQVVIVSEEEVAEGLGGGSEDRPDGEYEEEELYLGAAEWEIREGIEEWREIESKRVAFYGQGVEGWGEGAEEAFE